MDCGASLGIHTVEWAKYMTGWGVVVAFEAQERIYYALAGNIAINNCFNARAINAAVSNRSGSMKIPQPNYLANASVGSLELKKIDRTEFIGQSFDYAENKMANVPMVHLDSFSFPRLDILKIDVEGIELEVIEGAATCIGKYRPIMLVEALKTDPGALQVRLESLGYTVFPDGLTSSPSTKKTSVWKGSSSHPRKRRRRRGVYHTPLPWMAPRMPIADKNS
ncbi:MAG: FkbM family methyltransferase [Xanthobacteraceae bacterium]